MSMKPIDVLASVAKLTLLAGAVATPTLAQAPPRATVRADADAVVTAAELQIILKSAPAAKDGEPGEVSTQLFPGVASCSFIRLNQPDAPHVHPVSEIYVMQEGSGTLETGGTMIGPFTNGGVHHLPAGEQGTAEPINPDHGGSAIQGGHSQEVKAGDIIMMPAGVNHHWIRITRPLVYLDIKFPKVESRTQ
jgi:quercetin dioxygenase-like cupin family protein